VFVRFQGAVLVAVLVAIAGSSAENAILDRHRSIGRQYFRLDAIQERVARLRLRTEELGAPSRLVRPAERDRRDATAATSDSIETRGAVPLLRWRAMPETDR